jgi:hypothetical protein
MIEDDVVKFQVLTAANMKMAIFWVVAPCSLVGLIRRFRGETISRFLIRLYLFITILLVSIGYETVNCSLSSGFVLSIRIVFIYVPFR